MIKFLLSLLLITSLTFASDWRIDRVVKIKKDKVEKILVKSEGYEKLLTFRWTLYHNKWLVVFVNFNEFVQQHMLSLNFNNQSIRLELLTRGATDAPPPLMLIKFMKFDFVEQKAVFDILMRDKKDEIELKFLNKQLEENN